jgi:hypothetical protein
MNARKLTMMAAVLSVGLFTLEESALAQHELARARRDCRQVKARQVGTFDGVATTTGIVTKGGWLNGTYAAVFHPGALPTQDLTTITFVADFTLTTRHGELKMFNVYLDDLSANVGSALERINPTTSTGIFAGATGVLYSAATVISLSPFTVEEEITGEICFAAEGHQR